MVGSSLSLFSCLGLYWEKIKEKKSEKITVGISNGQTLRDLNPLFLRLIFMYINSMIDNLKNKNFKLNKKNKNQSIGCPLLFLWNWCKTGRTRKIQPLWISKDLCITEEKGNLIKWKGWCVGVCAHGFWRFAGIISGE